MKYELGYNSVTDSYKKAMEWEITKSAVGNF